MNKQLKITTVDLDHASLSSLQEFCALKGFGLHQARDASECNGTSQLFILDLEKSGRTGLDWVAKMKAAAPDTPILLLSHADLMTTTLQAVRLGAFHYLFKPCEMTDLGVLIESALEHARLKAIARNASRAEGLFEDYPTLEELEKRYMKAVLEKTRGRKEKAAKILGINRRTLYRKEREYGWVSQDDDAFENV